MHRFAMYLIAFVMIGAILTGCAGSPLAGEWMLEKRELPDGTIIEPPAISGYMSYRNGVRTTAVHWSEDGGVHSVSGVAIYDMAKYEYAERNLYYAQTTPGAGTEFDLNDYVAAEEVVYTSRGRRFQLPLHGEPMVEVGGDRFTATREGEWTDHWVRVTVSEGEATADGASPGRFMSVIPAPPPPPAEEPEAPDAEAAAEEAEAAAESAGAEPQK